MMSACAFDLHLHTYWSYDALAEPEIYFRRAREMGLKCLAIADHHVLDSLPEVTDIAQRYPDVRAVPAAEFTVNASIGAVDLVCYGFPPTPPRTLDRLRGLYHNWQRAAGEAISRGVQALGFAFSDSDRLALLKSYRPEKAIRAQGNTHVRNGVLRRYFLDRGYIASEGDYNDFMARVRQEGALPPYPAAEEVVPALKEARALIAIAHPRAYFGGAEPARMDALRAELLLDGIECAHRSVPADLTPIYRRYCLDHGLFSVAGSDCHLTEDVPERFGRFGETEWLEEFLARLDGR